MNNKEITKIFIEDQEDRTQKDFFKNKKYIDRDLQRIKKIIELYLSKKIQTPIDFYKSAFVLHHSPSKENRTIALKLAKKSLALGYRKAGWLYAAIIDRDLVQTGKKQRFGTQFYRKNSNLPFEIYPSIKVTKKTREKYGLPTENQTLKDLKRLNLKFNT